MSFYGNINTIIPGGYGHQPPRGYDPEGFLLMSNVTFLVDGFNLYHSIEDIRDETGVCLKWLDLNSLCSSYLPLFGKDARLQQVFYFTALATHLNRPDSVFRHKTYIRSLEDTGVKPIYGRFKPKRITCPLCHKPFQRHEEKETDVGIAVKLMELLCSNTGDPPSRRCDIIVLVTGDTDLAPAVRTAMRLTNKDDIWFAFPPNRKNKELARITGKSFKINSGALSQCQFPDPVILSDGTALSKPTKWA